MQAGAATRKNPQSDVRTPSGSFLPGQIRRQALMSQTDPDLKQAVEAYLEDLRRHGTTVTYAEAARALGLEPPATIHRLTQALEAIMTEDARAGRPLRAALVVSRTAPLPKPGFFDKARALGRYDGEPRGPEAARFHAEELARVLARETGPAEE